MTRETLLEVRGLRKTFPLGRGWTGRADELVAVDGVDLEIRRGEVLGLVGESGSGKSTLGRCVLRLIEPSGGTIRFDGRDFRALSGKGLRRARRRLQVVFQDPYASLNPRMTVGRTVSEALAVHRIVPDAAVPGRVRELLESVGLDASFVGRYPHELSGGERQRVAIARALAPGPDLIVADEPVSALDVSVQAQVLNVFRELKRSGEVSMLFISHDLAVVERMADRVAVLYRGRIVERASTAALIREPLHPYTRALLTAVPGAEARLRGERVRLRPGMAGSGRARGGCPLVPRCPFADDVCREIDPPLEAKAPGHVAACHMVDARP